MADARVPSSPVPVELGAATSGASALGSGGLRTTGGSCLGSPTSRPARPPNRSSGVRDTGSTSWLASSRMTSGKVARARMGKPAAAHVTPTMRRAARPASAAPRACSCAMAVVSGASSLAPPPRRRSSAAMPVSSPMVVASTSARSECGSACGSRQRAILRTAPTRAKSHSPRACSSTRMRSTAALVPAATRMRVRARGQLGSCGIVSDTGDGGGDSDGGEGDGERGGRATPGRRPPLSELLPPLHVEASPSSVEAAAAAAAAADEVATAHMHGGTGGLPSASSSTAHRNARMATSRWLLPLPKQPCTSSRGCDGVAAAPSIPSAHPNHPATARSVAAWSAFRW